MKTYVAHFSINGRDLTCIARDMMLSELVGGAYRVLTKGLRGDGIEKVAPKILDGDMKLIGNGTKGMTPKPDKKSAAYKEQLRYIFAGRVRLDRQWWRPFAEVKLFTPADANYATRRVREPDAGGTGGVWGKACEYAAARGYLRDWGRQRVAYYAGEGQRVFNAGTDGKSRWVIFEPVTEPPFWWDEIQGAAAALEMFEATGHQLHVIDADEPEDRLAIANDPKDPELLEEINEEADKAEFFAREERENERERLWEEHLEEIGRKVREQAGENVFDLKDEDGNVVVRNVPRAPFVRWALKRTSLFHLAPPWEEVAPSGIKLPLDDPNHTDWWLGAGISLDDYGFSSKAPVYDASLHEMGEIQEKYGNFECTVIVGGKHVSGEVGKNIVVVPDLHPSRLDQLLMVEPSPPYEPRAANPVSWKAEACITEAGGALAHLAQVAMERSIPILLVPDACSRLPIGTKLDIFPDEGRISIDRYKLSQ